MGDTTETNTNFLSRELFLGVVALQTLIQKNHDMRKIGPFPRYFVTVHYINHSFPTQLIYPVCRPETCIKPTYLPSLRSSFLYLGSISNNSIASICSSKIESPLHHFSPPKLSRLLSHLFCTTFYNCHSIAKHPYHHKKIFTRT